MTAEAILTHAIFALVEAAQALLWPALFFALLCLLTKGRRSIDAAREAGAETRVNLALIGFDAVVIMPALAVLSAAVALAARQHGLVAAIDWSAWPPLAVAAAAIVIGDLVGYWRHRLEHCALLWPAHAIHHSDTAMSWLTLMRFHPVNRLTTALIDSTVLLALGLPAWAVIVNNMVRHWYGFLIHADLPWTYGRLGALFVSPVMHRWHHVREERLAGHNFATIFSIWDRAFGTRYVPGLCREPLGVFSGGPTLGSQLAYPFRIWGRAVAVRAPLLTRVRRRQA